MLGLVAVAAAVGLVVAVRVQRVVLLDDAAIYFRYASRLASGAGWTYNDGDHTNGSSSMLYPLVLAAARFVGADIETSARVVGTASYAAAAGLASFIGARVAGLVAGGLAGTFLVLSIDFQEEAMSGLEVALGVALGLAVLAALLDDREGLAGVLLGLALLNKFDAGLLAGAIGIGYLVVRHRLPWRLAFISGGFLAPWLVFSQVRFGAVLPFSAAQKVTGAVGNSENAHNVRWILAAFRADGFAPLFVIGIASLGLAWAIRTSRPAAALVLASSTLWGLGLFAFYSLADLGDLYSWYLAGIYAPIAIGGACTISAAARWVRDRWSARIAWPALALLVVICVNPQLASFRGTSIGAVLRGHTVDAYEGFEATRRDAGRYLRDHARPGDVVSTCWGWVAYEAAQATIAETCPLSTRQPVAKPTWIVYSAWPGHQPPYLDQHASEHREIAVTFLSSIGEGGRTDVIRVTPAAIPSR